MLPDGISQQTFFQAEDDSMFMIISLCVIHRYQHLGDRYDAYSLKCNMVYELEWHSYREEGKLWMY